jgi:5-methylcytosine-specific restriction endonuclease McrA
MRVEIWILLITGILIYDTYYDNKYSKMIFTYKKYYKILLIGCVSLFVYYLFKKKPNQFKNLLQSGNNLFRYLPVGREAMEIINPIFELTKQQQQSHEAQDFFGERSMDATLFSYGGKEREEKRNKNETINNEKKEQVKRNVSDTKKRYVASQQNWKCKKCNLQLTYTYEIDHIIALKDGGDNSIENLVALCRECHGQKTAETFLK